MKKRIKCDKCGEYSTPDELELEKVQLEWNPIGQTFGYCPHCKECGSFDGGTVYICRD